jgi:hypothetical protein
VWRDKKTFLNNMERLERLYESPQEVIHTEAAYWTTQDTNPVGLLTAIFNWLDHPLEFDDLVDVVGELLGYKDQSDISLDDNSQQEITASSESRAGVEQAIDRRLSLRRLWEEICQLPRRQRVALLLNLRDEQGRDVITLIPLTRTATVRQIAETLEIPVDDFAGMWSDLPMDDVTIAKLLGATRQQVINLRKTAKERLTRRMRTWEETALSKSKTSGGHK